MRAFLFSAVFVAVSSSALAQECSVETDVAGVELNRKLQELNAMRLRIDSRLGTQQFLIMELPDNMLADVPPEPDRPTLPNGLFDEMLGPLWLCGQEGLPNPPIDTLQTALTDFEAEIGAYEAAVAERLSKIEALAASIEEVGQTDVASSGPEAEGSQGEAIQSREDSFDESADALDEDEADVQPEGQGAAQLTPMPAPENPNLFRRILTLPSAQIRALPRLEESAEELPTFSVMYVFEESSANGTEWLRVSQSLRSNTLGWIPLEDTLAWTNMLVMEFAPKGVRSDVLFFESDTVLGDMIYSPGYAQEATEIYEAIAQERRRLANGESVDPQWDSRLVAIEPSVGVNFQTSDLLLPILDWRPELFDASVETNLLQVAAVPAGAMDIPEVDTSALTVDIEAAAMRDGPLRLGVVFVIDTTISMRPFIDRTREAVESFYDSFSQFETASFVSFGLVGFRDNDTERPDVEYTTRVFQPLDPEAPARQVLANLGQVQEAQSPTNEFKEDGLAGLVDAIQRNDWSPYDAKLIVFISDASMREGSDVSAAYSNLTAQAVAEMAQNEGITILPVHLLTPANQRNGDAAEAEFQYRSLAQSAGVNANNYFAIDAQDPEVFASEIKAFTDSIARSIFAANSGLSPETSGARELEEIPEINTLASAAATEIFQAQLESLAREADGSAPTFLAGWTADRDLINPDLVTLEVKVFLTRNQLSSLDKQLGAIIDAFNSGGDDPQTFFDNLQSLAAQTVSDPDVVLASDRDALQAILPTFLQNLPYRSEILDLDRDLWSRLSAAQQSETIERLEGKRRAYQDVFQQTDLWQDFGADDPLLQVTPIRLSILP